MMSIIFLERIDLKEILMIFDFINEFTFCLDQLILILSGLIDLNLREQEKSQLTELVSSYVHYYLYDTFNFFLSIDYENANMFLARKIEFMLPSLEGVRELYNELGG